MKRFLGTLLVAALAAGLGSSAPAAGGKDVGEILDKAIQALGGKEKLAKATRATWKAKGKISFGGNDNEFTSQTTVDAPGHFRSEFEGEFGGNTIKGVTVLAGDKGWRKIGDNAMEMDKDAVANEKRNVYLQLIPATILPLKGKGFKVAAAGEEKVAGKPAVVVKVTPPDGKEFRLSFDKKTGLPVKVTGKVVGFMGEEFTLETTYHDYKDFQGVKKATHSVSKRDGEPLIDQRITEFRVLDRVDPKTFAEPQ
jgi:hypothetical protein